MRNETRKLIEYLLTLCGNGAFKELLEKNIQEVLNEEDYRKQCTLIFHIYVILGFSNFDVSRYSVDYVKEIIKAYTSLNQEFIKICDKFSFNELRAFLHNVLNFRSIDLSGFHMFSEEDYISVENKFRNEFYRLEDVYDTELTSLGEKDSIRSILQNSIDEKIKSLMKEREIIREFIDFVFREETSLNSFLSSEKNFSEIIKLLEILKKYFSNPSLEDLIKYIESLDKKYYEIWIKNPYLSIYELKKMEESENKGNENGGEDNNRGSENKGNENGGGNGNGGDDGGSGGNGGGNGNGDGEDNGGYDGGEDNNRGSENKGNLGDRININSNNTTENSHNNNNSPTMIVYNFINNFFTHTENNQEKEVIDNKDKNNQNEGKESSNNANESSSNSHINFYYSVFNTFTNFNYFTEEKNINTTINETNTTTTTINQTSNIDITDNRRTYNENEIDIAEINVYRSDREVDKSKNGKEEVYYPIVLCEPIDPKNIEKSLESINTLNNGSKYIEKLKKIILSKAEGISNKSPLIDLIIEQVKEISEQNYIEEVRKIILLSLFGMVELKKENLEKLSEDLLNNLKRSLGNINKTFTYENFLLILENYKYFIPKVKTIKAQLDFFTNKEYILNIIKSISKDYKLDLENYIFSDGEIEIMLEDLNEKINMSVLSVIREFVNLDQDSTINYKLKNLTTYTK